MPLPEGDHFWFIGQDAYFLGFPFGLYTEIGEINNHFPIPIVKKAIFSGKLGGVDSEVILLDGINNSGFSGGPVVYRSPKDNLFRIAAVVSAWNAHEAPVYLEKKTLYHVHENTGIIISYGIKHELDIIGANPIGAQL
jgi:hypothetical protein